MYDLQEQEDLMNSEKNSPNSQSPNQASFKALDHANKGKRDAPKVSQQRANPQPREEEQQDGTGSEESGIFTNASTDSRRKSSETGSDYMSAFRSERFGLHEKTSSNSHGAKHDASLKNGQRMAVLAEAEPASSSDAQQVKTPAHQAVPESLPQKSSLESSNVASESVPVNTAKKPVRKADVKPKNDKKKSDVQNAVNKMFQQRKVPKTKPEEKSQKLDSAGASEKTDGGDLKDFDNNNSRKSGARDVNAVQHRNVLKTSPESPQTAGSDYVDGQGTFDSNSPKKSKSTIKHSPRVPASSHVMNNDKHLPTVSNTLEKSTNDSSSQESSESKSSEETTDSVTDLGNTGHSGLGVKGQNEGQGCLNLSPDQHARVLEKNQTNLMTTKNAACFGSSAGEGGGDGGFKTCGKLITESTLAEFPFCNIEVCIFVCMILTLLIFYNCIA